ncbi:hypothetical protein TBLA_0C02910 [Henningerozyma blattae CBS 6284]|uniref:Potassium channel domain-containing protein n=1 Tax=Henningerozyma blattae (strain ATCC 34711 / CBS 6284 / DSM 70876 / NBRC 10599 / NRRL Y-10934 / UCD 77-7) TaxID=1071380 RepID=I2H144_HENB6|nr:hypothetical protein TBLA_0C02910 [Tetrapisispora blattae CBS 6284]CCH60096.1 hypothetical protein TBLA_0C02910 [Tetrapisispora blattae CBS 6284]
MTLVSDDEIPELKPIVTAASAPSALKPDIEDLKWMQVLQFSNKRASIINADPASPMFTVWFSISCYFPVITACLAPVANTLSIACAVEKWKDTRVVKSDGTITHHYYNDPPVFFVFNILSLAFGVLSNFVLLLHFTKKVRYVKSQILNIVGWTIASGILLVDVIVFARTEIKDHHEKSIGFWCAAYTSALYFGCTCTLTIHFIGYKLKKYPPQFNLIPNERVVMVFTVLFSIWLSWGAAVFSAILGMSYCTALYFSIVSLLTVGLGDILPVTVAGKIIVLAFSLTGVIILGLIIAITRGIITRSSGPIYFFNEVERRRSKAYDKVLKGELILTDEESFELIMKMRKVSSRTQKVRSIVLTIGVFIAFWLLGALVFVYCESWNYFVAIYFCFLCLLTIGYGDYYPETGAGRAFFIVWSIMAIPLMSTLISTVGDTLYSMSKSLDLTLYDRLNMGIKDLLIESKNGTINFLQLNRRSMFSGDDGDINTILRDDDGNNGGGSSSKQNKNNANEDEEDEENSKNQCLSHQPTRQNSKKMQKRNSTSKNTETKSRKSQTTGSTNSTQSRLANAIESEIRRRRTLSQASSFNTNIESDGEPSQASNRTASSLGNTPHSFHNLSEIHKAPPDSSDSLSPTQSQKTRRAVSNLDGNINKKRIESKRVRSSSDLHYSTTNAGETYRKHTILTPLNEDDGSSSSSYSNPVIRSRNNSDVFSSLSSSEVKNPEQVEDEPFLNLFEAFTDDDEYAKLWYSHTGYHTKLEQLHNLLMVIKKMHGIILLEEDFELDYEQWSKLYKLDLLNRDRSCDDINPYFWISPKTPLKYPLDQPHFVVMKLFNKVGEIIADILNDKDIHRILSEKETARTMSASPSNIRPQPRLHSDIAINRTNSRDSSTATSHSSSPVPFSPERPHVASVISGPSGTTTPHDTHTLLRTENRNFQTTSPPASPTSGSLSSGYYGDFVPLDMQPLPEEGFPPVMQWIRHGRNRSRKIRRESVRSSSL